MMITLNLSKLGGCVENIIFCFTKTMTIIKSLKMPESGYPHRIHRMKKYRGGRIKPLARKPVKKILAVLKEAKRWKPDL